MRTPTHIGKTASYGMRAQSAHTDQVTGPKRRINPTVRQASIRPTADSPDQQTRRRNDKWTTELHPPLFIGLALAIVLVALGVTVETRFTGAAGIAGIAVAVIAGLFILWVAVLTVIYGVILKILRRADSTAASGR